VPTANTVPRDYKHRALKRPPKKPLPGWLWLVTGVLLGGFVMGLIWLDGQSVDGSGGPAGDRLERTTQESRPAAAPGAEEPVFPKPRFDFYDMLPEMEVVVPDEDLGKAPARKIESPDTAIPASYLVQVGSFRRTADADRLKAQLALLGIEARVVEARISAHETRYRVRSGPYLGETALHGVRQRLADNGFKGMVIRVKSD